MAVFLNLSRLYQMSAASVKMEFTTLRELRMLEFLNGAASLPPHSVTIVEIGASEIVDAIMVRWNRI